MREAKKGLGPEAAAASGGNRRAERRKRQGALARLCRLPGSAAQHVSPYRKKNAVSEQAAQQPTIETVSPRKAYSEHDKRRLLSKEPPFDMRLFEAA